MSKNVHQVYLANPSTTNGADDLFYIGKSPYGLTDDSAIKYSDLSAQFMLYNANLQGIANLNNLLTGPVIQTGISGGVTTYHTPVSSATTATSFDNVANGVQWGDQVDFTSASPKTITLTSSGQASGTGFYWIVVNSGAGAITFSGAIYGPTTLPGGNGTSQTPMAICSVVNVNNTTGIWYVNVVNGFNLSAGTNISLAYTSSGITINNTGAASFSYSVVSGTSQAMAVNKGYIANNGALVTLTLPATFAVGDMFEVRGLGAGGWKIAQNSGQQINLGSRPTTLGATGFLASTNQYDVIRLVGVTANTVLTCDAPQGNITVN